MNKQTNNSCLYHPTTIVLCFCPQPDQDDHVLNLQFSWHGLVKPVGSAFIGTSPEFEMAIFTVVFLLNTDRSTTVLVNIDQCQMELVVIRHGRSLGTAYPKLLSSNSRHLRQHSHWCGGSSEVMLTSSSCPRPRIWGPSALWLIQQK